MAESRALEAIFGRADRSFFAQHPDRQARIRLPYQDESAGEFWSLGPHERVRRRIILWRVPKDNPYYDPAKRPLLKIPFLVFADETIEDRDDILLPIINTIMTEAKQKMGVR